MIRELLQTIGNLFTWIVVVSPWEQGLRIRLGKRVRLLNAGIYLRIPFIDRVYRQSIRRRLQLIPAQNLTSADGKIITIGASVGYIIVDLIKLYDTLHDPGGTIESEVGAIIAQYIATHPLHECSPAVIEEHARSKIQLEKYGLGKAEFFIQNFVSVKAMRIITGEIRQWSSSSSLNTSQHDGSLKGGVPE